MKIKKRNSNYELLRITSMFMIVIYHIIVHSSILANTAGMIHYILTFIEAILIVHVNSFVLVTGYYQCKSNFKFKKLVALNNQVWFYRVAICVALILFNVITLSRVDIIRNFMPIDLGFYWFIDIYMLLYCISPFLNILINKMDQKTFRKLLVACFIIICLIPSVTRQQAVSNNSGYSLANFIFLYFIGAYFRIYKIEIWEFLKINSLKLKQLIYFGLFTLMLTINFAFYILGCNLLGLGSIARELGTVLVNATYSYDNPLVIIGALMYFLWFGCLTIDSKFINKIGSLVFGVYLIHDNPYIRSVMYQWFHFNPNVMVESYKVFPKILIVGCAIFVICLIIEGIRQIIFYLISKLRISKFIRDKWYNYIEELKSN
jgi:hypothetical protein